MSELISIRDNRANSRRHLLVTVSAVALLSVVYGADSANASDDADQPIVWIALGGQLSRLSETQEPFAPSTMNDRPSVLSPSQPFEKPPLFSIDETGKISFEPSGTGWLFSASVRYGRSNDSRAVRQGTHPKPFTHYGISSGAHKFITYPAASKFADTLVRNDEQHLIADFQAGKDVGLGMFGNKNATSIFSLGIRYAQFSNKTNISLKSDPDWHFHLKYIYGVTFAQQAFHTNRASLSAERSFHGVGPTLSWDASLPFAGNSRDGELSFNGGLNAAVLFGRQRTTIDHQVSGQYCPPQVVPISPSGAGIAYVTYQPPPVHHTRVRTVVVPNVGGFAGATFRIENFKVSAGYRADFFFGAMDGGIDTRKNENVGFYGPFATISVRIGG